jgi:hypothetical protein
LTAVLAKYSLSATDQKLADEYAVPFPVEDALDCQCWLLASEKLAEGSM